jgi:hypothetical protein
MRTESAKVAPLHEAAGIGQPVNMPGPPPLPGPTHAGVVCAQAQHIATRRPAQRRRALRIIKVLPGNVLAKEVRSPGSKQNHYDQLCERSSTRSSEFLAQ